MQGHAGTVPMRLRNDPLAGAVDVAHWLERRCQVTTTNKFSGDTPLQARAVNQEDNLVCTIGTVSIWPGASNVIPGAVNISIDIRCNATPRQMLHAH